MTLFEGSERVIKILTDEYDKIYYVSKDLKNKHYFLYKKSIYGNNLYLVTQGLVNTSNYIIENNLKEVM